jgi:alcohol dehydrogenase class IV
MALLTRDNATIGPGALGELGAILRQRDAREVVLFTGTWGYSRSGAARLVEPALKGIRVMHCTDCPQNPSVQDIRRAEAIFDSGTAQLVVAIGGGTVLDIAKLANAAAANPLVLEAGAAAALRRPGLPLVAVPTTAGTGSEATHFATYYLDGAKRSLAHDWLRPDIALIDPELTHSLPPQITAQTGFDALGQAMESFWAVGANDASRALAAESLQLILGALGDAVLRPTPAARADMARAAWLAGRAIDISKTTAAHALSYTLTYDHGIAHGHAVALTLGAFLALNAAPGARRINDPRGAGHVGATMRALLRLMGCTSAGEAVALLSRLMDTVGLARSLPALGITDVGLADELANQVNLERLGNNPVEISRQDVVSVYRGLF